MPLDFACHTRLGYSRWVNSMGPASSQSARQVSLLLEENERESEVRFAKFARVCCCGVAFVLLTPAFKPLPTTLNVQVTRQNSLPDRIHTLRPT